jgi:hypothetical protein
MVDSSQALAEAESCNSEYPGQLLAVRKTKEFGGCQSCTTVGLLYCTERHLSNISPHPHTGSDRVVVKISGNAAPLLYLSAVEGHRWTHSVSQVSRAAKA